MATSQLETSLLKLILESDKPIKEDITKFVKLFGKKYNGKISVNENCWDSKNSNEIKSVRISMYHKQTVKKVDQEFTITWTLSHTRNFRHQQSQLNLIATRVTLKNEHSYHVNDRFFINSDYGNYIQYSSNIDELTEEDVDGFIDTALVFAIEAYKDADKRRIKFEKCVARLKAKRERIKLKMLSLYGFKDNKVANEAFDTAFLNTGLYNPSEKVVAREFKILAYFLNADPNADDPVEELTESK